MGGAAKQDALGAVAKTKLSSVEASFSDLRQWENFFAYPGPALLKKIEDRITQGVAAGTAAAHTVHQRRPAESLLSHERRGLGSRDVFTGSMSDKLPISSDGDAPHRPYFEVLIATAAFPSTWTGFKEEFRKLRRQQDTFIYETVFVSSFEDAVLGTILNGSLEAVIISDGIPFSSLSNSPLLREFLSTHLAAAGIGPDFSELSLSLGQALKLIRPELDIYLLSDREVEKVAGDPGADCFRRIFYQVEEPLELHLSILDGVADRFNTPFFDNLQKYAQRPIGTFHALPIARGKSIFKSNWISDMGRFYGVNLFLAESSATTGGLDSLLEPTGNIKVAQELAARAFGADHVFFVTNGTSTSNKMVEQALLAPGDIMVVDRNCHKSHHYGAVLAGACRST